MEPCITVIQTLGSDVKSSGFKSQRYLLALTYDCLNLCEPVCHMCHMGVVMVLTASVAIWMTGGHSCQ